MNERLIQSVKDKLDFAFTALSQAEDYIHHPAGLWYHSIAIMNAYYALREELTNRTSNSHDTALDAVVKKWLANNKQALDAAFGTARNKATHQGTVVVKGTFFNEYDSIADATGPRQTAKITVDGTGVIDMKAHDFLGVAKRAFVLLEDGIMEINRLYKENGGSSHSLHEQPMSSSFKNMKL